MAQTARDGAHGKQDSNWDQMCQKCLLRLTEHQNYLQNRAALLRKIQKSSSWFEGPPHVNIPQDTFSNPCYRGPKTELDFVATPA